MKKKLLFMMSAMLLMMASTVMTACSSDDDGPNTPEAPTEEGTRNPDGLATGIDHLKEIGVTYVQLLPSTDLMRGLTSTRQYRNPV